MPAVNYEELFSRHGYHSTTTTNTPTITAARVSEAFKKEMFPWPLAAGYRNVNKWAKVSRKGPCFHCGSVKYKEENGVPGAPPSPAPTFSKEI
uniref:Uncharacterized protein n=1 Tax=Strongyloides venezuelensis TaxID=75913 RepID=A0A0K0F2A8_STRVS